MRLSRLLFNFIYTILDCNSLKKDEDKRGKTVKFGVRSIVLSVSAAALAVLGAFLLSLAGDTLLFVFALIIAVVLLASAAVSALDAIVNAVCQLVLNRKPVGFVALAVLVASVAVAISGMAAFL